MVFKLDFNDVFEGNSIKDGTYECVINKVSENATPGGSEYIQFDLVIREDFDQAYKKCHIFHKSWKGKGTQDDKKRVRRDFNTIAKAASMTDGMAFKSLDELYRSYEGRAVKVIVKNETSEYNGNTYNNLNVKRWEQSKLSKTASQLMNELGAEIQDDDLPF